jgi:hypothetical protein
MSVKGLLGILPNVESVWLEIRLRNGSTVVHEYGRFPVVDVTSEDITQGEQVVTIKGEVTELQLGSWK